MKALNLVTEQVRQSPPTACPRRNKQLHVTSFRTPATKNPTAAVADALLLRSAALGH